MCLFILIFKKFFLFFLLLFFFFFFELMSVPNPVVDLRPRVSQGQRSTRELTPGQGASTVDLAWAA